MIISLVVPVYNMEKYLCRFLKSVDNQTSDQFELILVNDGSVDNSEKILNEYCLSTNRNVKLITKNNGGLCSARNEGLKIATGDFVTFPDPDDWLESDYVESFLYAQELSKADFVCLGYCINYDDKELTTVENFSGDLSIEETQIHLLKAPRIGGFAWNKIFKLQIIRENQLLFREEVGVTEDLDFSYRYLLHSNKVYCDLTKLVYHYYQGSIGVTRRPFNKNDLKGVSTLTYMIETTDIDELKILARIQICINVSGMTKSYYNNGIKDQISLNTMKDILKKYWVVCLFDNEISINTKIKVLVARFVPSLFKF